MIIYAGKISKLLRIRMLAGGRKADGGATGAGQRQSYGPTRHKGIRPTRAQATGPGDLPVLIFGGGFVSLRM